MQTVKVSLFDLLIAHKLSNRKLRTVKSFLLSTWIYYMICFTLIGAIVTHIATKHLVFNFINNGIGMVIITLISSVIDCIIVTILFYIILLCITRIPIKKYINIYDSKTQNIDKHAIHIPQIIDAAYMIDNKIYIYKYVNNRYKFLTILNPLDSSFNNQKFWKTHQVLVFNGKEK